MPFRSVEPGEEASGAERDPRAFACARALEKARGAHVSNASGLLLAVDTVVALDGEVFGKPADAAQARATLARLAGRTHEVLTAHCFAEIRDGARLGDLELSVSRAEVTMRALTPEELEAYLGGEDWRDKAGGYGIQSEAAAFTELASGRFDTVVGLDVELVRRVYDGPGSSDRGPSIASPDQAS